MNVKNLETRIIHAKHFLDMEVTNLKTQNGKAVLGYMEIGHCLDAIHEVERIGLRNLDELDSARILRTLTNIEARMQLSRN